MLSWGVTRHKMINTQLIYIGLRCPVIFKIPSSHFNHLLPKCVLDNGVREKSQENGVISLPLSEGQVADVGIPFPMVPVHPTEVSTGPTFLL